MCQVRTRGFGDHIRVVFAGECGQDRIITHTNTFTPHQLIETQKNRGKSQTNTDTLTKQRGKLQTQIRIVGSLRSSKNIKFLLTGKNPKKIRTWDEGNT